MEIVTLVASAVSVVVALGAIIISRIYYSRTSRLVYTYERTAHVLEKSVDQVFVMLNKLSLETEEAYGRIESGVNQLADAAAQVYIQENDSQQETDSQEDLSAPTSVNGNKLNEKKPSRKKSNGKKPSGKKASGKQL